MSFRLTDELAQTKEQERLLMSNEAQVKGITTATHDDAADPGSAEAHARKAVEHLPPGSLEANSLYARLMAEALPPGFVFRPVDICPCDDTPGT
jgi:alpha-D-ribose 1-methylphosphonate 5-triphosphate diphosphatase PhnM